MTQPTDAMPFSKLMGVVASEVSAERVVGQLYIRDDLCTAGGIVHGGALMAFADALGALGAFATLPAGAAGTTTVESKTNFLAGAKAGDTLTGEAIPISVGRRLSVWQTRIMRGDGKAVALVTQTQMVL